LIDQVSVVVKERFGWNSCYSGSLRDERRRRGRGRGVGSVEVVGECGSVFFSHENADSTTHVGYDEFCQELRSLSAQLISFSLVSPKPLDVSLKFFSTQPSEHTLSTESKEERLTHLSDPHPVKLSQLPLRDR